MDIIEAYRTSFERYFQKPAPRIRASGKGGYSLTHEDGHRERLTTRELRMFAGLYEDMLNVNG